MFYFDSRRHLQQRRPVPLIQQTEAVPARICRRTDIAIIRAYDFVRFVLRILSVLPCRGQSVIIHRAQRPLPLPNVPRAVGPLEAVRKLSVLDARGKPPNDILSRIGLWAGTPYDVCRLVSLPLDCRLVRRSSAQTVHGCFSKLCTRYKN